MLLFSLNMDDDDIPLYSTLSYIICLVDGANTLKILALLRFRSFTILWGPKAIMYMNISE